MGDIVVGGATRVVIGRGVLDADAIVGDAAPERVAVVASPGSAVIADRVADAVGERAAVGRIEVPDGDASKTLQTVERVAGELSELGITRSDLIVGVGGGAITDLAGFVGAIYLRGVAAHYVATTLLAAVDAAIGGKTGVNLDGKNLIGAFRHPARVVIDVDVIDGLPDDLKRDGLSEALKVGFVGAPALVAILERDGIEADLEDVIGRAVTVKAAIVNRDFEERGERAVLNYGHTIGHAVEIAGGLTHGAAVAVGMVAAARVSAIVAGFGDERRHDDAIGRLGLPVAAPLLAIDEVEALVSLDKKRDREGLRMVVLEAFGRPKVVHVDTATVRAALAAIGIRRSE